MPKQSVKHRVLTVKEKLELIQAIERGVKKAALAREKGLPLTTVCTIWNSREKLWNSDAAANLKRCRLRGSSYADVEEALVLWLKKARSENLPVSGPLLVEKARTFALQLRHDDFVCSNGWLARFKARYNIVSKVVSGESAEANKDGAEAWENGQLRQILQDYDPEDIFNMDESALFFKLLPNRTLAFSGETCSGGKHSKDRISVAFAVNMTGNEKLPLLVIGKAAKPRCFKGGRLPSNVLYRNNGKAWMTAVLFEEYVRLLDRRFAAKNRRVVVVLDNASSHVDVANLTAIKLVFLAPNTTSLSQPLDQGVIRVVKQLYRKNLLRRMLLAMENGKTYSIDLLGAIHLLAFSWAQVESTTVQNCFRHAKFVCADNNSAAANTVEVEDSSCDDLLSEILERQGSAESVSFGAFRDVDNDVATSPGWSDADIIAAVAPTVPPEDSQADDDDTEEETKDVP
uniref:Putative tick transposon n=1 Tax=Ornithodoros turicata TaxID=34597 RepID=A0A2R5LAU9_9ACAR